MLERFKGIIKKNFILLWRSKSAILTILIGPLILISLLGLGFNNTGLNKISIAAYSDEYNEISNSLLDKLKENNLNVIKIESESECINSIKLGGHHLCIIIPANFDIAGENGLVVYLDKSKVNLVGNVINLLSSNIEDESSELSLDLTETLLGKLGDATTLNSDNNELVSELQPIYLDSEEKINSMITGMKELNATVNQGISKLYEFGSTLRQGANSEEIIEDILDLVQDSRDIIDGLEPSEALNELDENLEEIEDKIMEASTLNGSYWNNFEAVVGNISDNMGIVRDEIIQLSADLNLIKENIGKEKDIIDDMQINLDVVDSSLSNIKIKNATKIVNPIVTDIRPVTPEKSHLNYIFPTLLVLIIMFSSVLLSSISVIVEKKDGAFFRNFISPAGNAIFLVTSFITDFIIILLQLIIFFGMSLIFLDVNTFANLNLPVVLLVIISFFILLGILIGRVFDSEESGILFSIVITSVMMFFSDTILPMESMANLIYNVSKFNPFVLSESLLRKSIVYGLSIDLIWKELLFLLGWILLVIILILIADKLKKIKLIVVRR